MNISIEKNHQRVFATKKAVYLESYGTIMCKIPFKRGKVWLNRDWKLSSASAYFVMLFLRNKTTMEIPSKGAIDDYIKQDIIGIKPNIKVE